ncbi:MAG: HNH endonuclease [Verrucomicrobiales bacterium]
MRILISERAGNRCEYCHLPQKFEPFSIFQVDHVFAKQHIDDDSHSNLCLACSH